MPHAPAGTGPRRRTVLAAALAPLAVAGCATEEPAGPAPGPQPPAKDALVMVIRHAEKPYAGDTGEDDEGNDDPGSLAGRGRRRAEELARLFGPSAGARLPRPAALFATGGPPSTPARSRQTLAPLATALRMPVRGEFALGTETALASAALAGPMPALICWEHTGIPRLVHALGAHHVLGLPAAWPDRHDLVWTFTRTRGTWTFRELPQHLLPGDA
ncbi:hypothetical protein OOK31_03410 [Streptomyces sp. NBC_00249]|uniref:hypothetical protein n=1 Tax=Streptomyces sp. NBC_00249 TaxID=2975690 RepID=UPI002254185E|nr:hypothetical protein [Streptomyces sp. NBC_00249]MCX5192948.1 hypothetical protein [Streptomyces sp. NBC_00249]